MEQSRIPSLSLAFLVGIPVCVSVSTAQCRAHTHLYITLQRTVSLALQLPSSLTVCPLAPYNSCVSHPCIARAFTDCDPTIWYFILFYFTTPPHHHTTAHRAPRTTHHRRRRPRRPCPETHTCERGSLLFCQCYDYLPTEFPRLPWGLRRC